jgi:hypothetical protein
MYLWTCTDIFSFHIFLFINQRDCQHFVFFILFWSVTFVLKKKKGCPRKRVP